MKVWERDDYRRDYTALLPEVRVEQPGPNVWVVAADRLGELVAKVLVVAAAVSLALAVLGAFYFLIVYTSVGLFQRHN